MQDVAQERVRADEPPPGKAASPVRFAGLVFDLGACRLARESGQAIPLTRGELRLLRLFVSRPGGVLSRDAILEAVANRPLELFDRSVDALVVRLRRKIEADPQAPRLIVTVPGEDYRFDGLAVTLRGPPANGEAGSHAHVGHESADDPAGDIARAEKTADVALALQPENSRAHFSKGQIYYAKRQLGPSMMEVETAIALDPNHANAQAFAGFLKVYRGHAEEGLAGVETAFRLSPRDPNAPWWEFFNCVLRNHLAQWEQAIPWCEKSIAGIPQVFYPYVELAAANAWAGHDKEAKDAAAQLQKVLPGYTVQAWAGRHVSDDPTYKSQYQRIVEGLRKAGLPEGEAKKE